MADHEPTVIPMLSDEDGAAAMDWLVAAFGFRERTRMLEPDGRLSHGELEAGDGLIMLASPTADYESPRHHRETCQQSRKWQTVPWVIDGVLVQVDHLAALVPDRGAHVANGEDLRSVDHDVDSTCRAACPVDDLRTTQYGAHCSSCAECADDAVRATCRKQVCGHAIFL